MGRNLFSFLHLWEYGYVVTPHNWWVMPKKHCFLTRSNHFWEKMLGGVPKIFRYTDVFANHAYIEEANRSIRRCFAQVLPQPNGEQRHEGSCNHQELGGGLVHMFLFSPRKLGKMNPFWRAYFSKGLVQPPPLLNLLDLNWRVSCTLQGCFRGPWGPFLTSSRIHTAGKKVRILNHFWYLKCQKNCVGCMFFC